ncbi:MAG: winged helix-turn-helix domain-containing protein, partial [Candidatus Helarchaeota archaeon]
MALVASQKKYNRIYNNDDFWWLFGGTGGFIRYQIIELLLQKSYNACQMTKKLNVSYNNIRYHLDVLKKFK